MKIWCINSLVLSRFFTRPVYPDFLDNMFCFRMNLESVSAKRQKLFLDIFYCRIDLTIQRQLYFDDREMNWILKIKWIWKMK